VSLSLSLSHDSHFHSTHPLAKHANQANTLIHYSRKSELLPPSFLTPKHHHQVRNNKILNHPKLSHVTNHQILQSPSFTCSNKTSNLFESLSQFSESSTTLTTLSSNQFEIHQLEPMHVKTSQTHLCYTQPETHYKYTLMLIHQIIKPTLNH
jgi:hypothetical protein